MRTSIIKHSVFVFAILLISFSSCKMRNKSGIPSIESAQDTLSPLVVYEDFVMDSVYYTGPFHIDQYFGCDNNISDYGNIPNIPGLQYYSANGRHLAVRCPNNKAVKSLVSRKIKRFADWCIHGPSPYNTIPSVVPICNTSSSIKDMCSYYMKYIGDPNTIRHEISDTSSIIEQFALCIVDAYESDRYCTVQEYTWYDYDSLGDITSFSWSTVDKKTGNELSLSDIIDEENWAKFAYYAIYHLRDQSLPWFDISREVREDYLVEYLSMASGIALAPEGVIVYYHRQVIGCGVEGQYNALVPYSEIEDIIKVRF